jgi:hypothetical protein
VALPIVIAENQTGVPVALDDLGQTVPASGPKELTKYSHFYEIADSTDLNVAILNGSLLINDGTSLLTQAESLAFLNNTGNMNGPVTGIAANALVKLSDGTTGRYTSATGVTVDASNNLSTPGSLAATGGMVAGGSRNYGVSATDPVSPAPSDGDTYYNSVLKMWLAYDAARAKWLSVETAQVNFGRSGTTGNGAYYKGINGLSFKSNRGRYAEHNGTVVSLTYTRDSANLATFEVTANGTTIASIPSTATAGYDLALNNNFSQGDILGLRNLSGGADTQKVHGWVLLRWRL